MFKKRYLVTLDVELVSPGGSGPAAQYVANHISDLLEEKSVLTKVNPVHSAKIEVEQQIEVSVSDLDGVQTIQIKV